jgi:hypothetical protein
MNTSTLIPIEKDMLDKILADYHDYNYNHPRDEYREVCKYLNGILDPVNPVVSEFDITMVYEGKTFYVKSHALASLNPKELIGKYSFTTCHVPPIEMTIEVFNDTIFGKVIRDKFVRGDYTKREDVLTVAEIEDIETYEGTTDSMVQQCAWGKVSPNGASMFQAGWDEIQEELKRRNIAQGEN